MKHRSLLLAFALSAALPAVPSQARANNIEPFHEEVPGVRVTHVSPSGQVKAGAASIDSTWHIGSVAGQYATAAGGVTALPSQGIDPTLHNGWRQASYGLQGRESSRALVLEAPDGARIAVVANDLYIPQDLLNRRVGGLLRQHDALVSAGLAEGPITRIDERNMMISVSHSHSSPYQTTPSWGVWTFQDVFDYRQFEDRAQKMAEAVIAAVADLRPASVGGGVGPFSLTRRHSYGPTVSDTPATAGTPAGFPQTDGDKTVSVVRVDEAGTGAPIATWVTFGLHPEMLDGHNILTSEYVNTMYRFVDREVGGVTLFSQNDTGSAEPARDANSQPPSARAEFSHRAYAQMERAGRYLANAVEAVRADIGDGGDRLATATVPMATELTLGYADARLAPPGTRAAGSVSNCRAEQNVHGTVTIPMAGLPDCQYVGGAGPAFNSLPPELRPSTTYEQLRAAGVPVPDNIPVYSLTGLQETTTVHLQAFRIGDIAVTVCPCEQWSDQSLNIKSRLDLVDGNLFLGFDWTRLKRADGSDFCQQNGDSTWTCADPRQWRWNSSFTAHEWGHVLMPPVSDDKYRRMVAQIRNDAAGWDAPENIAHQETEPSEISEILGNFTHEELTENGYPLVITPGMTNDYFGYIASFREFQRGDHYRKALTGLGPHSMDFLATRLSRMAASLNGRQPLELTPKDLAYAPEDARMQAAAAAIGTFATAAVPAYEATLPPDGGEARILKQPAPTVRRFDAAFIDWVGGSNYTDLPDVQVERKVGGQWVPFANGEGEVQYRVNFPKIGADLASYRAGSFEWVYNASFETQNSDIRLTDALGNDATQTPAGTYRFVIEGKRREGAPITVESYRLESDPFEVLPWDGITVHDLRVEPNGKISFEVGPTNAYTFGNDTLTVAAVDYPDSYTGSPFPQIINNVKERRYSGAHSELFCLRCSFRPRAERAEVVSAVLTGVNPSGETFDLPAVRQPDGRFLTTNAIGSSQCARLDPGRVVDSFGERNQEGLAEVCR